MSDSETRAPIRVVVVDDHELVRGGLATILGLYDDIVLAGEADSGAAAVRLCAQAPPDAVLMDLNYARDTTSAGIPVARFT